MDFQLELFELDLSSNKKDSLKSLTVRRRISLSRLTGPSGIIDRVVLKSTTKLVRENLFCLDQNLPKCDQIEKELHTEGPLSLRHTLKFYWDTLQLQNGTSRVSLFWPFLFVFAYLDRALRCIAINTQKSCLTVDYHERLPYCEKAVWPSAQFFG